jgi:hypothetical protein
MFPNGFLGASSLYCFYNVNYKSISSARLSSPFLFLIGYYFICRFAGNSNNNNAPPEINTSIIELNTLKYSGNFMAIYEP